MKSKMTRQGVFAFWSIILLLGAAWAVYHDFNPEWKPYQQAFRELTFDRAKKQIASENEKVRAKYKESLSEIDRQIREATDDNRSLNQQEKIEAKRREVAELEQKNYEQGQGISFAKSLMGAYRSRYEFQKNDSYASPSAVESYKRLYQQNFDLVQKLAPGADKAYADLTKAKEQLKALESGPADLVRRKEQIEAEQVEWEKKVEQIAPKDIMNYTANIVRDLPLLDFVDPKFNLKQVVLNDLPDLTNSGKVDRCQTCHLGIDNPKYADPSLPKVFQAHPKLELYLGLGSPHPVEKFGCTVCHQGRGYGTGFNSSFHTPNDPKQEKEWVKKYGWKVETHFWDYPMLPKKNMQAMCVTCHKSTFELTMAEDVYKGRLLYERRGCHGCHKIEGVSDIDGSLDMTKTGPSLKRVASKLDPEWARRWIAAPRKFYPTTNMPHPFGHQIPSEETFPAYVEHIRHELKDPKHFEADHEKMTGEDAVMIESIATWLFENSDKEFASKLDEPPGAGDAAAGKALVAKVNCLGCHKIDDLSAPGQGYAPDLSKVGAKTNAKWLYNWLRDPKKYWPDGRMPNPRLTDAEANDVAAYLMTLKDDAYMAKPAAAAEEKVLEEIAVRYQRAKLSEADAKAKVAQMTDHDRKLYVGEESISRRGCFACHEIKGFENRPRIGAELTDEGFKELERFDFGMHRYVHTSHYRHEWIEQKVKQPYIFFLGKVLNPYEQSYYMPWFGFTDEEARQIASFILGQTGKKIPANYVYPPRDAKQEKREALLAGAKILERRNCVGCHPIGLGWKYVDKKAVGDSKSLLWLHRALVGRADPNLPEGRFAKIEQARPDDVKEKDAVVVDDDGFVDRTQLVPAGKDVYAMEEIFGEKPVEVNVGQKDEIKVPLEAPERLQAYGENEGYIAGFYDPRSMAPPVLRHVGAKLYPEWIFKFLKKVETVRNHIAPLRMPQWEWTDGDATKVVRYFSLAAGEPFPYQTFEVSPLGPEQTQTAKSLFGLPGTPEYQGSLKCLSCHPTGGIRPTSPPTQWGPDLFLIHNRSKVPFLNSWLTNPAAWAPGTSMPKFFYDFDNGKMIKVRDDAEKEIHALAEMLYHMPDIKEVQFATAWANQMQDLQPVKEPGKGGDEEFSDEAPAGGGAKKKKPAEDEEFKE